MSRALRDYERELVGKAIIAVRPTNDMLGQCSGLELHLSDGQVLKIEGDPTIGSRDVWVFPQKEDDGERQHQCD